MSQELYGHARGRREAGHPTILRDRRPAIAGAGLQIAHKALLFQWQDGKKVIVWPEELAPGKARFPTPPWSQR